MNSPLSNALEEQRLQAATQLSSAPSPPPSHSSSLSDQFSTLNSANSGGTNYELFHNSNPSIWSFGTDHHNSTTSTSVTNTSGRYPWGGVVGNEPPSPPPSNQ